MHSSKLLILRSDTKIKVLNFAKDCFSYVFHCTNNASTLALNRSDFWYAIEIGISPNKSLVISFQKVIHCLDAKYIQK